MVEKNGTKLYSQLKARLPYFSYEAFQKTLRLKKISINGKQTYKDKLLSKGDKISLKMGDQALKRYKSPNVDIVYEDKNIVVVNKPAGAEVTSVGNYPSLTSWLHVQLDEEFESGFPMSCHRLDAPVGGLVLFAKDKLTYNEMTKAIKQGQVQRLFSCLVRGFPTPRVGEISLPLLRDSRNSCMRISAPNVKGSLEATTRYRIATSVGRVSVMEVNPVTLHPHQIRVHFSSIGHPVLGDNKYGDRMFNKKLDISKEQMFAHSISFDLPNKSSLSYLSSVSVSVPIPKFNIKEIYVQLFK